MDAAGNLRKDLSRWLSVELTPSNAPWAFERAGEGYRIITTLEAFAVLLGVRFLVPSATYGDSSTALTIVPCYTDNQANGRALNKLFSVRHPLAAVVMELGEELASRNLVANVAWSPRATNEEADALSRGDHTGFAAALRVHVDLDQVRWHVFGEALKWGSDFEREAAGRRAAVAQERARARPGGRKRPRDQRLRARDPW